MLGPTLAPHTRRSSDCWTPHSPEQPFRWAALGQYHTCRRPQGRSPTHNPTLARAAHLPASTVLLVAARSLAQTTVGLFRELHVSWVPRFHPSSPPCPPVPGSSHQCPCAHPTPHSTPHTPLHTPLHTPFHTPFPTVMHPCPLLARPPLSSSTSTAFAAISSLSVSARAGQPAIRVAALSTRIFRCASAAASDAISFSSSSTTPALLSRQVLAHMPGGSSLPSQQSVGTEREGVWGWGWRLGMGMRTAQAFAKYSHGVTSYT
eukprot:364937-Chlamydomonas_euryale.AAC.19